MHLGAESKVPVGILEVRLELIPKINDLVGEEVISAQISLEKNRQAEKERLFWCMQSNGGKNTYRFDRTTKTDLLKFLRRYFLFRAIVD